MKILVLVCLLAATCYGRQGFGPGEQDWGYIEVRPGAFEFWWLYETTAPVANITKKPLVIWLQGGPGASSTGLGNLGEIGPIDHNRIPRDHTWVKNVNLLFIDNPVGAGYSYVNDTTYLTTTNKQIADDLVTCLQGFYNKRPEFRYVPLYIASQSYGGKMAVQFALELFKRGFPNIKGVNMIDAWISPIDSVLNWAPLLLNVGAIDHQGYETVDASARRTQKYIEDGMFKEATDSWFKTGYTIVDVAYNVDFYNILNKIKTECQTSHRGLSANPDVPPCVDEVSYKIGLLMKGEVKEALKLNVTWGQMRGALFNALKEDFMKPVVDIVAKVLDETNLKVQVVSGQLDLIVDTLGTVVWVDNMKWSRSREWSTVPRTVLSVNGVNEGYQKKLGNFALYWVNRAGHRVPADNPYAMDSILKDLIS
ncbi:hypothetical protein PPYR_06305 [Photinus pyralis]|uniref:Retinoid-inducible serine carboxypeptidase n=1 Tax=Photinus pyralis TaxID=7054 RepID=A0A5N4AT67_PHOPY|nr:retinoid-inducible serine carboxypeptidase-like [Photinus pyralis]KAB0800565.1 hypothetical protein PPYR_06305 [Photinus pyralis]